MAHVVGGALICSRVDVSVVYVSVVTPSITNQETGKIIKCYKQTLVKSVKMFGKDVLNESTGNRLMKI